MNLKELRKSASKTDLIGDQKFILISTMKDGELCADIKGMNKLQAIGYLEVIKSRVIGDIGELKRRNL